MAIPFVYLFLYGEIYRRIRICKHRLYCRVEWTKQNIRKSICDMKTFMHLYNIAYRCIYKKKNV